MSRYVLSIAVEEYQDSRISPVYYAENDASEFSESLKSIGLNPKSTELLLSSKATKTAIESKLRTITKYLTEEDELFLYYAGHGFAQAGKNYITCHDTINSAMEIAFTSVSLNYIFNVIRESACQKVMLFFDSCHSGLQISDDMRSLFSEMTDDEYKDFCQESEYYIAFSSCASDELSYPSTKLKHGVWTYHLVQALKGSAPSALVRNRFVTSSSLQNYLSAEVPRLLRQIRTDKAVQTPTCWGNMSREFIVADLKDVINARKAKASSKGSLNAIKDTLIRSRQVGAVRSLKGFKKHHKVPTDINHATRGFVQNVGTEDVRDMVEATHAKLKSKLKYMRRDLKVDHDDGYSTIVTPDFTYSVYLGIDEDEPSQFVLEEDISEIQNPDIVCDERFSNIFDGCFDSVEISFKEIVNIEAIIDAIEEQGEFAVQYPSDTSYCSFSPEGRGMTIRFEPDRLMLIYSRKFQIEDMLEDCKGLPSYMNDAGVLEQFPGIEA